MPILQQNRSTTLQISRQGAKSIVKPQTSENTLLDKALPFKETRFSSIHQNKGTNPTSQETFTRYWSNLTKGREIPQLREITTFQPDFTFTFHFHALEKEMATHSSVLAWRIPGTGEPGGLPSMGSHRVSYD